MAFKDILVHIDGQRGNESRLAIAVNLAAQHDAHLTGLFVSDIVSQLLVYSGAHVPPGTIERFEAEVKVESARAGAEFEAKSRAAGIHADWQSRRGRPSTQINLCARYTDLVVVGQDEFKLPMIDETIVDFVTLSSGRPVIMVPYEGTHRAVGKRVQVAWSGRREAVRAVNDALPILKLADEVRVVAIDAKVDETEHGDIPGADLCLHLARHGVTAVAESVRAEGMSVGERVVTRATENAADLIVMGAYGHSRFRELTLGGVTRHLLEHSPVPVLLSH